MQSNCESCEYFDYDEEIGDHVCTIDLDEDEYLDYLTRKTSSCPCYALREQCEPT